MTNYTIPQYLYLILDELKKLNKQFEKFTKEDANSKTSNKKQKTPKEQ